jgi:hypothetical protein
MPAQRTTRAIQREFVVGVEVGGDARDMIEFAPLEGVRDNGGQHRAAISLLVGSWNLEAGTVSAYEVLYGDSPRLARVKTRTSRV